MIKQLIKADKIYTAIGSPIENGMIAIDEDGIIAEVGEHIDENGLTIEKIEGAVCPAFVNAHCHLELSHLKGKINRGNGLDGFIRELQSTRNSNQHLSIETIKAADLEMQKAGIAAVGDICNETDSFEVKKNSPIHYHNFIELFAFDPEKASSTFEKGLAIKKKSEAMGLVNSIVPHSPYSVSRSLFNQIAREKSNLRISIHNQETQAENELYESGTGKLAELLKAYGLNLDSFETSGQNSLPSYLHLLPHDIPLLLVHNTFTSKEDIDYAEAMHSKLYWCFCPKANLYIENTLPDFSAFIASDLKCTLGTDGLSSNDGLSIFEEMKTIQSHFTEIKTETLVKWACLNGAEFLGIDTTLGSIEVGKKAKLNQLIEKNGRLQEMRVLY